MDYQQHFRIINDSMKLIQGSKKLDTRLSRIDVAARSWGHLHKYEQRGVAISGTRPSKAIDELKELKTAIIRETVQGELETARTKSQNATTPAGKVSPLTKVIDKIGILYQQLDDVSVLDKLEQEARKEMDKAQLTTALLKAEKAEFKGQNKKALDAYLDALFIIKRDSIDDTIQQREISKIQSKIRELGGQVPTE